jgi:hypothetical protein
MGPVFERGDARVRWMGGGLLVEAGGEGLVVDAPAGLADALRRLGALGRVHGVVMSSGRMGGLRGLLGLLEELATVRRAEWPVAVWGPAGDERIPALVEAWQRGWPGRFPVALDGVQPGDSADLGAIEVSFLAIRHGEPVWGERPHVAAAPGCALRLVAAGLCVVYVPGAAPSASVARLCRGADLAIVEVGVREWPASDRRWRLSLAEALEAGAEAGELWIVGDDGALLSAADA